MNTEILIKELRFKAIRSSGPGGQHANKVSSKVVLTFNLDKSKAFDENEKELLLGSLKSKLSKENLLILTSETTRSQHKNKEIVIAAFLELIQKNLIIPKHRKATKPSKLSTKVRLNKKKNLSFKKALRRKPKLEE